MAAQRLGVGAVRQPVEVAPLETAPVVGVAGRGLMPLQPLPPHITFEQAKKMAQAMAKGDPERAGVMEKSFRGKLAEFLTR